MLDKQNLGGLELLTVTTPIREEEKEIIEAGSDLLFRELPKEKALAAEDAIYELNDPKNPNYGWRVLREKDGKAVAVAVYDTILHIPKTPVNANMLYYLVSENEYKPEAKTILDIVLNDMDAAVKESNMKNIGVFADDVPNCTDILKKNGFEEFPFDIYVPSLEEGKEREISSIVHPLIRPSKDYANGIPNGYMQKLIEKYLWEGYNCPSTSEPQIKTKEAIQKAIKLDK